MGRKEKDADEFGKLLCRLELEGRKYGKGDTLTEMLGGEKFSYATRSIVSQMFFIIEDNPEFAGMVPEELREFFEGYRISWTRSTVRNLTSGRVTEYVERSLGRKPTVRGMGKVVAEEQRHGEYLVMFPDGNVEHAANKAQAEQKARKWFDVNMRADAGVGVIEWRMRTAVDDGLAEAIPVQPAERPEALGLGNNPRTRGVVEADMKDGATELLRMAKELVAYDMNSKEGNVLTYLYGNRRAMPSDLARDLSLDMQDARDIHDIALRGFEMGNRGERWMLDQIRKILVRGGGSNNPLDGMSNLQARREVHELVSRYTKGLFSDQSWEPVHMMWKAMTAGQLDWVMTGSEYLHDNSTGATSGKEWKFEVRFTNRNGRPTTLYGTVIASWAGSVVDPSEKYDLTVTIY